MLPQGAAQEDQHGGTANQYRGVATAAQVFSFDNNTNGAMKDYFASHEDAIVTANSPSPAETSIA